MITDNSKGKVAVSGDGHCLYVNTDSKQTLYKYDVASSTWKIDWETTLPSTAWEKPTLCINFDGSIIAGVNTDTAEIMVYKNKTLLTKVP